MPYELGHSEALEQVRGGGAAGEGRLLRAAVPCGSGYWTLLRTPHLPPLETPAQVLAAVADYQPPTAASTGRYSLARDSWREFDPFYPHYSRRDLQSALHAAQESGAWQPEWQLQAGLPPLPAPLAGLQRLLHHSLRIVWAALLLGCTGGGGAAGAAGGEGGGGAAEDCALAATHLLCLAVQRKRADLAALLAGEASAAGAPPLPESWRSPAGFRAKCEEHLAGAPPRRPGILHLLRVLAGQQTWVDGSRREGSWEVRCAAGRCRSWLMQCPSPLLLRRRQVALSSCHSFLSLEPSPTPPPAAQALCSICGSRNGGPAAGCA